MRNVKLLESNKLFRLLTVILAVIIVLLTIQVIYSVYDYDYHAEYEEEDFLYRIRDEEYVRMPHMMYCNQFNGVKETAGLRECYAVAEYYEAALLYHAYQHIDRTLAGKYLKRMEAAEECMGELAGSADKIDAKLASY